MRRMGRGLVVAATMTASIAGVAPGSAAAAERCVGPAPGCFGTLPAALAAAHDGDTIRLAPGTFHGGVTVTKSVHIVGAGRSRTTIAGGGPVLTLGEFGAEHPPTIGIRDLTVTGGHTTSSSESAPFTGQEGVIAAGGGISIPPGHVDLDAGEVDPGATVNLLRVTVSDNRAAPVATAPFGPPCPGGDPCPFARGSGGGIESWGALTIDASTVRDNRAGPGTASDAYGGAIMSQTSSLRITNSRIADNRATASAPEGRFAEGGAILHTGTGFALRRSVVSQNASRLDSSLPSDVEQVANAGGVHIGETVPHAVVDRTGFYGNSTRATNPVGDAVAFSAALEDDSPAPITVTRSTISGNRTGAATTAGSTALAHADTGGIQLYGSMRDTFVGGNSVRATSANGDAEAVAGGLWALFGRVSGSSIHGNRLEARSPHGSATVRGGGAVVDTDSEADQSGLTLTRTSVAGNTASPRGATRVAQGGGVFDAFVSLDFGPIGGPLAVHDSRITGNVLGGGGGATRQGGGIYVDGQPFSLTGAFPTGNVPDQCFGCAARRASRGETLRSNLASGATRLVR